MAEHKAKLEREYIIPLRKSFIGKPYYKRARKAAITIKEFIARHMKVPGRDLDNVKLDVYLNNEIWARGKSNPPAKIKVKAVKEGDIVSVTFAELPDYVKFAKSRAERKHKLAEKKAKAEEAKPEEKKTEEQKKDEAEKEKATEIQHEKEIKQELTAEKHLTKAKPESFHRMALQK